MLLKHPNYNGLTRIVDDHHSEIKGVPGFEQETKQNKHKLRTKVYNYNQYYTDGGVYQNETMCTRV